MAKISHRKILSNSNNVVKVSDLKEFIKDLEDNTLVHIEINKGDGRTHEVNDEYLQITTSEF